MHLHAAQASAAAIQLALRLQSSHVELATWPSNICKSASMTKSISVAPDISFSHSNDGRMLYCILSSIQPKLVHHATMHVSIPIFASNLDSHLFKGLTA